jgi:hypothetical protein
MKPREYIDFKLYLTRPEGGGCQVSLLPTPEVGETITPVTVLADQGPSTDQLPYLAGKSITLRQLVQFGKGLANWLLPEGTIRSLFSEALKRAGNTGGVRLRLVIADHGLKRWPWEYVYFDPLGGPDSMRGFLALEPRISLIRHEPLPFPHPEPIPAKAELQNVRMLLAAASPKSQKPLQIEKEVSTIREAIKDFKVEGLQITIDPLLMDATPPEVGQALQGANSTYLFHFVGHGASESFTDPFSRGATREEGYLYFIEDKTSKSEAKVKADDLAKYLQQAGVRLAVMGACYSGNRSERYPWDSVAGAFAARAIPSTIAMQYEIIDSAAIDFAQGFYSSLSSGLSLDEAMSFGRLAMYRETATELDSVTKTEWGVPVLYSRLSTGVLFPELARRETATANQIRMAIQQTVDTLDTTGEVVGIEGKLQNGSYTIVQKAGIVRGRMVGLGTIGE